MDGWSGYPLDCYDYKTRAPAVLIKLVTKVAYGTIFGNSKVFIRLIVCGYQYVSCPKSVGWKIPRSPLAAEAQRGRSQAFPKCSNESRDLEHCTADFSVSLGHTGSFFIF